MVNYATSTREMHRTAASPSPESAHWKGGTTHEKSPHQRMTRNGIEDIIRRTGRRVDVHAYPHRFRGTALTNALNRGMPLQDVQELAGHSDINTTRMYYRSNKERVRYEYLKVA